MFGANRRVARRTSRRVTRRHQAFAPEPQYAPEPPPQYAPDPPAAARPPQPAYVSELERLAQLKEQGLLTEEEFAAKKKQILGI